MVGEFSAPLRARPLLTPFLPSISVAIVHKSSRPAIYDALLRMAPGKPALGLRICGKLNSEKGICGQQYGPTVPARSFLFKFEKQVKLGFVAYVFD